MQKVVNNLLSNALKHTPAQGSITLSIRKENGNAIIEVKDSGTGIEAKEADKIFERFYQVDNQEDTKDAAKSGTGIGLALTKGIVELHHGSIRVESELGKGSNFIVTLPLDASRFSPSEIAPVQSEEQPVQPTDMSLTDNSANLLQAEIEEDIPLKRRVDAKMLIVEDNDSIREMLAEIFKPFYAILTAPDGAQAWELLKQEMPDIVVSDVVMPNMSGTELCKRIKTDNNTCHIPVVLLTAAPP